MRKRHKDSGYGEEFCNKIHFKMNQYKKENTANPSEKTNITNASDVADISGCPDYSCKMKELFQQMWQTIVPAMEVLRPGWRDFLNASFIYRNFR